MTGSGGSGGGAARALVLVRHGKAEGGSPDGSDAARALAPRGLEQAGATAAWLARQGLGAPALVLVSSATRAAQTWAAMAPALHPGTVREEPALYETSPQALVHLLAQVPDEVASLLVVAHEPVLSLAAVGLAGEGSQPAAVAAALAGLGTGAAAVLRLEGPWSSLEAGAARLEAVSAP